MTDFQELNAAIQTAMHSDVFSLRKLLRAVEANRKSGKPFDRLLSKLQAQLSKSITLREERARALPAITWDEQLPVVERREEISEAIRQHQVVVVCGETGSGKSTQLPKIALALGRGIGGVIGHTQPRRIAARSIAARLSQELNCTLGQQVGYRIRFGDQSGPRTLIRLMTDGIMLAETQTDRFLDQYDTIIVDEAHERSLNIDFLLGYLKRLLPRRRDLRLVITSATIDAERFASHFETDGNPAPVLMVSGRTYPVELRYRPLEVDGMSLAEAYREELGDYDNADPASRVRVRTGPPKATPATGRSGPNRRESEDRDWIDGVVDAVDELASIDSGHILVFLPTERDIREVDKKLSGRRYPGDSGHQLTQIVPLFGRLSSAEQDKVFQPFQHRRIVLATNVAESSLTVPGIRYVIDTGTARMSRYSARSRIQRLPVEPVSQASANQRSGRCGRIGPGVCIRLYSEQDFAARDPFTTPEIQRTNLASVILRTISLRLGAIEEFPFLDPPRTSTVREGYKTLEELGAIDSSGQLTDTGRRMSRLPVDPRISRIILASIDEQAFPEVLAIAAALEIQDPRERPIDKQQQADEAHSQFRHRDSDFMTLLNLWDTWHERKKSLSNSQLRKWCQQNFLSWLRMREWVDVHRQLKDLLSESDDKDIAKAARLHPLKDRRNDMPSIHRSLMTGLLANIAWQTVEGDYSGAGGNKLVLWPGSALAPKGAKWIVAAELVETSKRFARTVARIQPEWIEPLAAHLVSREYSQPHWDANAGNVMIFEKVTLWGMPIVPRRKVPLARIDAAKARELFIQHGLVEFGLLFGDTEDERESEWAEEEEALTTGSRSRLTPGRSSNPGGNQRKGWGHDFPFLKHNKDILNQIQELQHRTRRHDLLPTDEMLFAVYSERIPEDVADRDTLKRWYRRAATRDQSLLRFDVHQFIHADEHHDHAERFPETARFGVMELPLTYQLDPGKDADGVTVTVPAEGLGQLMESRLSWLVPGLLEQKVLALIRSLPKSQRRHFVPAPDTAKLVVANLDFGKGDLLAATAGQLSQISGERIEPKSFDTTNLPDHLKFHIRVVNDQGKILAEGCELSSLRDTFVAKHKEAVSNSGPSPEEKQWHRTGFTAWEFADVPTTIDIARAGMKLHAFPAIRDDITSVALTLCQAPEESNIVHRSGLRRLIMLTERKRIKSQIDNLPKIGHVRMMAASIRDFDINHQLMLLLVDRAFLSDKQLPRTQTSFNQCVQLGRNRLGIVAQEFAQFFPVLFTQLHETRLLLDRTSGPGWTDLLNDMKSQLSELFHQNTLGETPWPWLIQFPRYLTTIRQRIQRLNSGGLRTEQSLQREFSPWSERYTNLKAQLQQTNRTSAMLNHYRWMLEEYRVSLFAQKLGTAIQVSTRKLDEQWERVMDSI
ncbi:MAG: DUF3418 domain-containing protein [Planctomycetaceae bacterium]